MPQSAMNVLLRHVRRVAFQPGRDISDSTLLQRFTESRDEAAFETLVQRHGPMVLGVCRRVLGNRDDADDAFQATFLVLVRKAAGIRRRDSVGSWLYGVAVRLAQRARVDQMRRRQHEQGSFRSQPDDPPPAVLTRDLRILLDAELSLLPERFRAPLVLCYLEGKTYEQAAQHLGWREGTLRGRLARGREMLRSRLLRRGVAAPAIAVALAVTGQELLAAVPARLMATTVRVGWLLAGDSAAATGVSATAAALADGMIRSMAVGKLKAMAALLFGIALLAGAGVLAQANLGYEQPQKSDTGTSKQSPEKPRESAVVGKISGRVIHADDVVPLAGAEVRLIPGGRYSATPNPRHVTTNAQGEFTFDGVSPGQYHVLCFHGNLASRSRMYRGHVANVAADGACKPVVLKMRPGVSIHVKVISEPDAKPVAGARVRLIWTDTDRDHLTDAKGEVELPALTAETYHVEAAGKGLASQLRIINLANEQPAALVMKLPPGASVQGIVRDENGRPLTMVGINWYESDISGSPRDYVETDAEGRYRFDHLPLGQNLRLYLSKLDYLAETKQLRLDSPSGSVTQLDVVVKRRPHGGSVQGVVTTQDGKPISGAEVINEGGSSDEVRRAKTDSAGKFLLDDLYKSVGDDRLIVKAEGFAPQRVDFKPGPAARPTEIAVKLQPGHRIQGIVLDEKRKPIAGVRVYFAHGVHFSGREFGGSTTTDARGRFAFDSLPEKTPFHFLAEGYSEIPEIELPLDGDNEVIVRMRSQGVINGRVMDAATGKPIPRFTVRLTFSPDRQPDDPAGTGIRSERVDPGEVFVSAQGEFVLNDLMAGMPLQVSIIAEGYRRQIVRRIVAQSASEAETVEIRAKAEDPAKLVTVRGKFVNHKGEAVSGAELRLVVATDRRLPRDAFPFNWQMIETGQVDQMANVLQFQRKTTAANGAFEFQRVPGDAEIELVYWGKGVPDGRIDHIEALPEKERTNLLIKAAAPARVAGTIDRKVFPEFSSIQLSGSNKFYSAVVGDDGKSFTVNDLPAGRYEIQVYGPYVPIEGRPGGFTYKVLARKSITLEAGKEANTALGKAERVDDRSP